MDTYNTLEKPKEKEMDTYTLEKKERENKTTVLKTLIDLDKEKRAIEENISGMLSMLKKSMDNSLEKLNKELLEDGYEVRNHSIKCGFNKVYVELWKANNINSS